MSDIPMRILIACETSGIGRRAFAARWPNATVKSCDLEPAEDGMLIKSMERV